MQDAVLVDGARTAFGRFGGALRDVSATDLGTVAAKGAIARSGVDAGRIDQIIFGNVCQTSSDACYISRHIGLAAGLPERAPALTVNRVCGSGLNAIVLAAQEIQLGHADFVLAGGSESMSQAPHVVRGSRWGIGLGDQVLEDTLWSSLTDTYIGMGMANTAEKLARHYGITRQECDEFSLESTRRAARAGERGRLAREIVAVTVRGRKGDAVVERDEHVRPDVRAEDLARLPARFERDGVVTAATASGIADGAAAVIVASASAAAAAGLRPLARIVAGGICGVDPSIMGIGPAPASRQALARAGLRLEDVDLVEINEAFAGQYLAVEKDLGLDRTRTNVNGGAIALGHPLGASGTRLALTLAYEMRERGARYGLASLCVGGGQGIAAVFERISAPA